MQETSSDLTTGTAPAGCCKTASAPATTSGQHQDIKVVYGTLGGTAKGMAEQLSVALKGALDDYTVSCLDVADLGEDVETWLLGLPKGSVLVVVMSTYEGGSPPPKADWFCKWLEDAATDFRVGAAALAHVRFAVFGCGNSAYDPSVYNVVAKRLDKHLAALGGQRVAKVGLGDEDGGKIIPTFKTWGHKVSAMLKAPSQGTQAAKGKGAAAAAGAAGEEDVEDVDIDGLSDAPSAVSENYDDYEDSEEEEDGGAGSEAGDMEDIGGAAPTRRTKATSDRPSKPKSGPPEMLSSLQRASLAKQGYKVIGSHSGVKLCRWTKAMLRGRGGCYKHTFYGIESHRCMEATPSLACANKCVFCWRHHTNPVGRSWKWAMDEPQDIVQQAVSMHQKMVREYAGAPGVTPQRAKEGMEPRHCALSLVGEPIMYPEINALVSELHRRRMSSFMVTNAQFPDRIQQLRPVTQLYVSVDAATPEALKKVDRPLFADFWERFTACLTALRDKRQRTVYRLTLVKGMNMDEVAQYAALVDLGRPDFIEIKGVTFCGESPASGLTMDNNVPYHYEVVNFAKALCEARNGEYGLACEHAHSCSVLLARPDRFLVDGRWHTWIDYEKFQELAASGQPFSSTDYSAPTPDWAAFGAPEGGFDPAETRWRRIKGVGQGPEDAPHIAAAAAAITAVQQGRTQA